MSDSDAHHRTSLRAAIPASPGWIFSILRISVTYIIENIERMARPVRKWWFSSGSGQSASTYPVSGLVPGRDGDPRCPILIIRAVSKWDRSMFQVFKPPFDCQAIFLSPHADPANPATRRDVSGHLVISLICGRQLAAGVIGAAMRQDRPGNARQLVGQRNNDNILVRSRLQPTCPPAKRRLPLNEIRSTALAPRMRFFRR